MIQCITISPQELGEEARSSVNAYAKNGTSPEQKLLNSISSKRILLLLRVSRCARNPLRSGIDSKHFLSFCLRRTTRPGSGDLLL